MTRRQRRQSNSRPDPARLQWAHDLLQKFGLTLAEDAGSGFHRPARVPARRARKSLQLEFNFPNDQDPHT
jgi:hypothetical protein